jgi:hypothetical protein
VRAKHPAPGPLVICSDGLATPAPNTAPGQTFSRLRSALKRLTLPRHPIAWLHPRSSRALADWLPRLCRNIPISRFESM